MHRVPVEQTDVRGLHKVCRLPPHRQALAQELPASHLPQLAMDERHELFQGLRVTAAPGPEQPSHVGGLGHVASLIRYSGACRRIPRADEHSPGRASSTGRAESR
jgi:hypothetical protein